MDALVAEIDNDDEEDDNVVHEEADSETDTETEDEISDASDDDGDEDLIKVRQQKIEIKTAKQKELEVECEVEEDDEQVQSDPVNVEIIGTEASSATGTQTARNSRKKVGTPRKRGGLQENRLPRLKLQKKNNANTFAKAGTAEHGNEDPTYSSDEQDGMFGTIGMKAWSSEYEHSEEDVPASPKSSSNSEWKGEELEKKRGEGDLSYF